MEDKEIYKRRIEELRNELHSARATGRSCRMLNDYIEKFFHEPMGTRIEIFDHYFGWSPLANGPYVEFGDTIGERRAREMMCRNIKRRLDNEYPNIEYELTRDYYLIRKSPTYREKMEKELNELQEKLKTLEDKE